MVDHITVRRSHLEYKCASSHDLKVLMEDINSSPSLRDILMAQNKPFQLYKTILIGVPSNLTVWNIIDSLTYRFFLQEEEITMLRSIPSSTKNDNDCILLMPLSLAKFIIQDGGLVLWPNLCKLRPFTLILLCNKRQKIDHGDRRCSTNEQICSNCGEVATENHVPETCSKEPSCINWKNYNATLKLFTLQTTKQLMALVEYLRLHMMQNETA